MSSHKKDTDMIELKNIHKNDMSDKLIDDADKIAQDVKVNDEQTILLEKEFKDHKCLYFTCFFVIGLINEIGYVIVATASQDLAIMFNYNDQMPLTTVFCVIAGAFAMMANSRWLLKINHELKIKFCTFVFSLAYLIVIGAVYLHNDNPEESYDG